MRALLRAGLLTVIMGLAVLFFVLDPVKDAIFPRCVFYSLTGYHCPGCGSQRAIHNLLHLNLSGVVSNNALLLPATLLIFYHYARPLFNRISARELPDIFYLKQTPWIIFAIIILFGILRNIPFFPFSVLAPG